MFVEKVRSHTSLSLTRKGRTSSRPLAGKEGTQNIVWLCQSAPLIIPCARLPGPGLLAYAQYAAMRERPILYPAACVNPATALTNAADDGYVVVGLHVGTDTFYWLLEGEGMSE